MEDDQGVCKLVELFFAKQLVDPAEMKIRRSSYPPCLLTSEFTRSFADVLNMRQMIVIRRWRTLFDSCCLKMLSSHEMYLKHVAYACLREHECNQNIFDSFISVCALLRTLSNETLRKTGIDFCVANPFIFMIFYRNILKEVFCRRGGFHRLVEYIGDHRYRKWKGQRRDLISHCGSNAPNDDIQMDYCKKFDKELKRERIFERAIDFDEILNHEISGTLAHTILINMDGLLPPLPSYADLVKRLVDYRKKESSEIRRYESFEEALQECLRLSSHSKENFVSKPKENKERNEDIIQEVINYNHSKHPVQANSNNRIQEEAGGILKHLQDTIKSLIQTIDEYASE